MTVLVTGHLGFLGQHLTRRLGAISGLDRKAGNYLDVAVPHIASVEAVVHCAAYADIASNWVAESERRYLYRDNVTALVNVLEAYRGRPFVFISTAAVLSKQTSSPYSATKKFGEELVKAYARAAGMPFCIVRPVSFVGHGYSHGHIADFVSKKPKRALDNGQIKKPFAHVEDVVDAIVGALSFTRETITVAGEPWNWVDTARVMGLEIEPGDAAFGFPGDPWDLDVTSDWPCTRSVERGVREALESLGWSTPKGGT